ncbi:MAG: LLM class flavin-dependent oxidoreductase, partial [Salana multivorans]|nr:LLM class flavin-dependent oxidoreductase [Salana multivorans]
TDVPDYRAELRLALDLLGPGHRLGSEVVRSGVGSGSGVEVWALASSPGESARAAGELGLPLAANYHVAPSSVLETVAAYRAAFRPGVLDRPYVIVSADVLVATTQDRARALARGFEDWVLGVRSADGAVAYPRPDRARLTWSDAELALVADRSRTRFVGDGPSVVAGLDALRLATAADEVLVTTIAHDPEARLDSFRLLAAAWATP